LAHNNLGVALAETGRVEEALAHYRKALELSSRYPDAHNNLGEALAGKGRLDEAIAHFEKALQIDPSHAGAHANLGAVLARAGRVDQAIPHLERAIEIKPDDIGAHKNLGLALAGKGRFEEATRCWEEAVRLSGGRDPALLDLLGRGYAALSRFPEAAETERRALAAAERKDDRRLVEILRERLSSYESGRKR
jgi:Tfp pilus assembly protein PilF